MTTSDVPSAPTPLIGPPPPLDPELAAGLAAVPEFGLGEMTMDMIPARRRLIAEMTPLSDAVLRRNGEYEVSTRRVPGPEGAPDVELLICLPAGATAPVPAIYHIHGGGRSSGTTAPASRGCWNSPGPTR